MARIYGVRATFQQKWLCLILSEGKKEKKISDIHISRWLGKPSAFDIFARAWYSCARIKRKTVIRTSNRRLKFRESRNEGASAILAMTANGPGSCGLNEFQVCLAGSAPVIAAERIQDSRPRPRERVRLVSRLLFHKRDFCLVRA